MSRSTNVMVFMGRDTSDDPQRSFAFEDHFNIVDGCQLFPEGVGRCDHFTGLVLLLLTFYSRLIT